VIFNGGILTINFSRIYNNIDPNGQTIYSQDLNSAIDATNNWWGSNSNPSGQVTGPVSTNPWLVLGITANPTDLTSTGTSAIRTNLTYNSDGTDTSAGGIYLPDNMTTTFAVSSFTDVVWPGTAGTVNGGAGTTFRTFGAGDRTVSARVDDQTVFINMTSAPDPSAVTPTPVWTMPESSGGDDGPAPIMPSSTDIPPSEFPIMTVTVNIGGDSKVWQAIVTGTKLSELIVTGTVQSGSASNMTPPTGIVYQYISLVPARYTSITKAVINFTIPQSCLDDNHIAPGSIVLYHQTTNGWEALPTTVLSTKDGTMYFSAESTGFSLFAIAGTPTIATPLTTRPPPASLSSAVKMQTPAAEAVTQKPIVTETTAAPAPAEAPAGSSAFPVLPALIGISCVGLIGGGVVARRWWIRQQNPALFAEYD
jgi:PGF-pre-PGF domain-containing protein